jgi:hypothetical protein
MPRVREMMARPSHSFQHLVVHALAQGELVALNGAQHDGTAVPRAGMACLVTRQAGFADYRDTRNVYPLLALGSAILAGAFWGDSSNVISLQKWETLRAVRVDIRPRGS